MTAPPKAMRDALLLAIYNAMQQDKDIFFVTADFGSPVLDAVRADFPDRFINVGIAEQNLINVSAGLALEGYKVFAYAIAPFITMRCYEQIRVSLALLSQVRPMNVTLIGVGAGYSYVVSGPTHQCFEDLTLMRALPTMAVYSPADTVTTAALLPKCLSRRGPSYVRLDAQVLPVIYDAAPDMVMGYHVHRRGGKLCLLATGYMTHTALQVAEQCNSDGFVVGVVDLFDITGFDQAKLRAVLAPYQGVITMEEGFSGRGGLDAVLHDFVSRHRLEVKILPVGMPSAYRFELGSRAALHAQAGIGPDAVRTKIDSFLQNNPLARQQA